MAYENLEYLKLIINSILSIMSVELLLAVNYYFVILIHEAGHLLLGKMSGYQLLYIRIGNRALVKTDKGYHIKNDYGSISSGQCFMYPLRKSSMPFYMFSGGIILNIFAAVIFCILTVTAGCLLIKALCCYAGVTQVIAAISNLMINNKRIITDGRCIKEIKSESEIDSYHFQLEIVKYLINGVSYSEMPDNIFHSQEAVYGGSSIVYEKYIYLYYRKLEIGEIDEAERLIGFLIKNIDRLDKSFSEKIYHEAEFMKEYKGKHQGEVIQGKFIRSPIIHNLTDLRYNMFRMEAGEIKKFISNKFENDIYQGEINFLINIYNNYFSKKMLE